MSLTESESLTTLNFACKSGSASVPNNLLNSPLLNIIESLALLNSFKPIENQYWVGWVDLVGKKNNWYV